MGKSKESDSKLTKLNILKFIEKIENICRPTAFIEAVNIFLQQNFPEIQVAIFKYKLYPEIFSKTITSEFSDYAFENLLQAKKSSFKQISAFYVLNDIYLYPIKNKAGSVAYIIAFKNVNNKNVDDIQTLCLGIQSSFRFAMANYNQGWERSSTQHANMISQICHDFNSLISLIKAHTEIDSKNISDRINYSTKMTKDILLYVREIELLPTEVDIIELIESIIQKISLPGNIKVEIKNDCESSKIILDVELIDRAIGEVINNSVAAIGSKNGKISITTEMRKTDSIFADIQWLLFKIRDNGCGIHNDFLPFIKDPFFTTMKSELHNGLGLSIADKIVREHDGLLEVSAKQKTGTVVNISIPLNHFEA